MKKIVFAGFEENLLITKGRELFVLFGYQFLVTLLSFSCVLWMCITYKPVLKKVKKFLFLFPIPDKVGTESSNYWHKTGVLLLRVRFSMTVCVCVMLHKILWHYPLIVVFKFPQNIWCYEQDGILKTCIVYGWNIDFVCEQR